MSRTAQLIVLLVASWCVMTFTHEMGHVVLGLIGGGTLRIVELRPWHLPHSHFQPDPHPLVTLWGGPVLGVVVPLAIAFVIRRDWAWFIANFCLLANGAYLATAWLVGGRELDTLRLLAAGAHPLAIVLYCTATIGVGYIRFRRSLIAAMQR